MASVYAQFFVSLVVSVYCFPEKLFHPYFYLGNVKFFMAVLHLEGKVNPVIANAVVVAD